jgi:RNA polymerase sigma-70 factor (ECF subfamily)
MVAERDIRKLFPYAYNILGSVDDARDVVQEVLVKHLSTSNTENIRNEKNYLIRSVINLAINTRKRKQRTLRSGEVWLPEPVATDDTADRELYLKDVLSYSLLVLLERLSAPERAVFILRETFDYTHEEIGSVLSITQQHSRKLLSRAKAKLYKPASLRAKTGYEHQRRVLDRFLNAIRQGDTRRLEGLMVEDIQFYVDGGGKVPFLAGTCTGSAAVATLQLKIYQRYLTTASIVITSVNHQSALLYFIEGRLTSCQIFEVHPREDAILQINAVLDPEKLKSLPKQ